MNSSYYHTDSAVKFIRKFSVRNCSLWVVQYLIKIMFHLQYNSLAETENKTVLICLHQSVAENYKNWAAFI